jgi:hypothetical protein
MTDRKLDQTISKWLEAEAPTQLPDRVLRATFERTRKSRQGGWHALLGRMHVNRFALQLSGAAVILVAVVIGATYLAPNLNRPGIGGPTPTASPSPEPTPAPADPEVTALLNGFLEARVAGNGAEQYLNAPEQEIPLLYATTSGAPYERAEFEQVRGIEWPYGFTAFKVRLFAGGTVVEQLFFTPPGGSRGLEYQWDGFGTDIAPTTEDGQPVAMPYNAFGGEATLQVAHPWVFYDYGQFGAMIFGRLIPEGPGVLPTTDGGQRGDWDELFVIADPALLGADCQAGPDPADAAALAESIRSDPDLGATAPVAVSVGGTDALMMDVKIAAEATICVPATSGGDTLQNAVLEPLFTYEPGASFTFVDERATKGPASGEWMRLYLLDVPQGLSMRILAIAIVAPESRFERAVEAAAPLLDTIEFPFEQIAPPSDAEITASLGAFLQARIDGDGAEGLADFPAADVSEADLVEREIPLLYTTSTGARYERSEFELVQGPVWPYGSVRYVVRLFAENGETTVEQHFSLDRDETDRLRLVFDFDEGSEGGGPGTTENGKAVPVEYGFLDGTLTYRAAYPLAPSQDGFRDSDRLAIDGLLPDDDAPRRVLIFLADPRPIGPDCVAGPAPVDATALAQSIESDPDFEATAPVAVTIGGLSALQMDVALAPGASSCSWSEPEPSGPESGPSPLLLEHAPFARLNRARIYLLDLPGGSAQVLAIVTITDDDSFETVLGFAAPVVDSIEFHAP